MALILELSGLFLGVLTRTLLPYIRKLKQGEIYKFDKRYIFQAAGAVVLALISVVLIIPGYSMSDADGAVSFLKGLKMFAAAFAFGFGWNALVNEGIKWNKPEKKVAEKTA